MVPLRELMSAADATAADVSCRDEASLKRAMTQGQSLGQGSTDYASVVTVLASGITSHC
jgi:hypothetical protein